MHGAHASDWHVPIAVPTSVKGRASRCPRVRRRVQVKKGSCPKPPHMRTVILRMGQAPPIHHVTETVMTMKRLLICFKKFSNFWKPVQCLCLVYRFGGWLGGWVVGCPTPPPPPWGGAGQFWVTGFSRILGGWVSEFTPPPPPRPPVTKQIPEKHLVAQCMRNLPTMMVLALSTQQLVAKHAVLVV